MPVRVRNSYTSSVGWEFPIGIRLIGSILKGLREHGGAEAGSINGAASGLRADAVAAA